MSDRAIGDRKTCRIAERAAGCLVNGSILSALLLVGWLLTRGLVPKPRPDRPPVVMAGPDSVLIQAGSVEARLQFLERQLVELRAEVDALKGGRP